MAKEVAGGPFTEETKTSPTAGSSRGNRTAACQTNSHTNNQPSVRSATPKALPRAGNRRLVEHETTTIR